VLLPALLALGWGALRVWRRDISPVSLALVLNGLFIASLPAASADYMVHSARIALAVLVSLAWAVILTRRRVYGLAWLGFALTPLIFFRPGLYF
jgi:hypothetical protein